MKIQTEILNAIQKFSTIIVQRHQHPDPDAIGSQMGLARIIKDSFPDKKVYCVGKQYSSLSWMGSEDTIPDHAYQGALVIVTDTANRPRIDDSRYQQGQMLIKIDHHPNVDNYGDLHWVEPKASSASEMVYDLCASTPKLKLSARAGSLIYAGIVGDTGRFMYPSTSAHTFYVASRLAKLGVPTSKINGKESEIDLSMAHLSAYLYQNLHILKSGAAYLVVTSQLLESLDLTDENTSAVVPLPGNIRGVKNWAIFVEQDDGTYRIRLRSNGPAIDGLAANFGGGGHALASGAVAKNTDEVKQAIHQLSEIAANYQGDLV